MTLFLISIILICTIATLAEAYKKVIRKGNFHPWEVWIMTIILSLGSSYLMNLYDDLGMGIASTALYFIVLLASQYLVDMNMVKKIFNIIMNKNLK